MGGGGKAYNKDGARRGLNNRQGGKRRGGRKIRKRGFSAFSGWKGGAIRWAIAV